MKPVIKNCVKIVATGFVVLLLLSLPLFWARCFCEAVIFDTMPPHSTEVRIEPSGLFPPELENDPNMFRRSCVEARMIPGSPFYLGILDYFAARVPRMPGTCYATIYYYSQKDDTWIYFDEKTGQIVCHCTYKERIPENTV